MDKQMKDSRNKEMENIFMDDMNRVHARHIIMNDLETPLDGEGIAYNGSRHVHVVIVDGHGSDLCMALLRQAALVCHYPNFDERTAENRTRITYVDMDSDNPSVVLNRIQRSVCSLWDVCGKKVWTYDEDGRKLILSDEGKLFIDIELNVVALGGKGELVKDVADEVLMDRNALITIIAEDSSARDLRPLAVERPNVLQVYEVDREKLRNRCKSPLVDMTRAKVVNMVYNVGSCLKGVSPGNLYNAGDYENALNTSIKYCLSGTIREKWDEISSDDDYSAAIRLSNLNCADGLEAKRRSALAACSGNRACADLDGLLQSQLKWLAVSEHARWNTEKLVSGFRIYTDEEKYEDEFLFGEAQKESRSRMKRNFAHIDICSAKELVRVNPENFKYDCFLVLAVNDILNKRL